jgi:serine/threonine protein kinase
MYALFQNKKKATLYFVMEYCKGRTVMNFIEDEGPLPEAKALRLFAQLLSAVKYLHQEQSICHR